MGLIVQQDQQDLAMKVQLKERALKLQSVRDHNLSQAKSVRLLESMHKESELQERTRMNTIIKMEQSVQAEIKAKAKAQAR